MGEVMQRADGAPAIKSMRGRAVPRSVTVRPELDERVVERMRQDGLSYSAIVEEALRHLLGERVA
jgi:uncharacterized protein (DUF4415 family)